tara:strand:- start:5367 stop:5861 length:495 start_codon:yes stop_codon:yes gene_type:complete
MPNKPDKEVEDQGVSIDPQKKYLMDQFGVLMQKVGDGFGVPLQQELVRRLEQTIADFHEEVTEMMEKLKENSEKRHDKLKQIWENPDSVVSDEQASARNADDSGDLPGEAPADGGEESAEEMSDWEKRIEAKAAGGGGSSEDPEPSKEPKEEKKEKKGLFGRKK